MAPVVKCKFDELVPIKSLVPFDRNRNIHTKEQIARLAKLIDYQGIRAPIVVAKAPFNCIAKGHGTTEALILLGCDTAPVVYQEFQDYEQLYLFVQSDNAISEWAALDLSGINTDIGEIGLGPDTDLELLGIKDFVLEPADLAEPNKNDPKDKNSEMLNCPNCGVLIEKQ